MDTKFVLVSARKSRAADRQKRPVKTAPDSQGDVEVGPPERGCGGTGWWLGTPPPGVNGLPKWMFPAANWGGARTFPRLFL
jgi:hypothetical protein